MGQDRHVDADIARTLLEILADLPVGTEVRVSIFYGKPRPSGDGLQGWRLSISASVADLFRTRVVEYTSGAADAELVAYDPGRELLDGESSFRATDDVPRGAELLDRLDAYVDMPFFQPNAVRGEVPNFYVVSVRERGEETFDHLLRKLTARYRLQRTGVVPLIFREGTYNQMTEEPILLADDFDAVMNREVTVVSDQRHFDAMLGLVEEALVAAKQSLAEVTADLRFANYEEFESAVVGSLNMLSKLRSISELRKDPRYREAMTMKRMVEFARSNPRLGIVLSGPKGRESLVFHNDPQRRWKLLRVLDDAFVRSLITDFEYEANSKSRLS